MLFQKRHDYFQVILARKIESYLNLKNNIYFRWGAVIEDRGGFPSNSVLKITSFKTLIKKSMGKPIPKNEQRLCCH